MSRKPGNPVLGTKPRVKANVLAVVGVSVTKLVLCEMPECKHKIKGLMKILVGSCYKVGKSTITCSGL